jgi:hypothetical protein
MKLSDIKKYFIKELHNGLTFMHVRDNYRLLIDGQQYDYYVIFADNTVEIRIAGEELNEKCINLPHVDTELTELVTIYKVTRKEVFTSR